jgi:hypothetical protein
MPDNLLDSEDAPKHLTQAMQEPLVTRWWTIGSLAQFATKYLDFFLLMAKACCNMTKTDVRENIIASNLLSLASSDWIVADIYLIAGVAKSWLNPHMRWYQGSDPNIKTPGFLSFHRQVRYFLMMENLKKIENSWREMDEFSALATKLHTMTNLTQKKLKEDMVSSFVKKMASQVRKHNKRYLLTKHLVRAVFAECQTGQAVAQFLKGGNEGMPSLSAPYFSEMHNQEINCEKFMLFLKSEISLTTLEQLRIDPAVHRHREAIDQIAIGLDIWDATNTTNENAHLLRKGALQEYAAHASTQHNNERLVKLGALMSSTGKGEIMASIFAIASNDFMTEHHDEETDLVPANQQAVASEDAPERRKRGNNRGKKKLLDLERVANEKGQQLAEIARELGAEAFNTRIKAIGTSLKSKADNLLERSSNVKVSTMMGTFNHPDKQPNARQRKRGEDMPPRLLGYFPYVPFGRTANIGELEKELNARNVTFEPTLKVTKKCDLLKKNEVQRFEEQIDAGLTLRGYVFVGLKLAAKLQLLRQDITEKEESTNGEYDIDIAKYFKLLSPDVDETIFEEQE